MGYDLPACDISVNNTLAIHNSRLVAQYLMVDLRMRPLAIFLKAWARAQNINDRSQGTLSSFALTLMLIHHLQRECVLPSLQNLSQARGEAPEEVLGFNCQFCTDPQAIQRETSQVQATRDGSINTGALLHSFLNTYKGGVIAVRTVDDPDSCMSPSMDSDFFFVENPFEPGVDVANVDINQCGRVRHKFRKAWQHLTK